MQTEIQKIVIIGDTPLAQFLYDGLHSDAHDAIYSVVLIDSDKEISTDYDSNIYLLAMKDIAISDLQLFANRIPKNALVVSFIPNSNFEYMATFFKTQAFFRAICNYQCRLRTPTFFWYGTSENAVGYVTHILGQLGLSCRRLKEDDISLAPIILCGIPVLITHILRRAASRPDEVSAEFKKEQLKRLNDALDLHQGIKEPKSLSGITLHLHEVLVQIFKSTTELLGCPEENIKSKLKALVMNTMAKLETEDNWFAYEQSITTHNLFIVEALERFDVSGGTSEAIKEFFPW